jgi:hypothetical protein
MKDMIWDEMNETKAKASEIEKQYEDYMEANKGAVSNNDISKDDFFGDNSSHAYGYAKIAGYDAE